jgi:hypothetical protein
MTPPSAFALLCPVCGGQVEKTGELENRSLYACKECDCDLSVPTTAWDIARVKREQKWLVKKSSYGPLRFGAGASVAWGPGTRDK